MLICEDIEEGASTPQPIGCKKDAKTNRVFLATCRTPVAHVQKKGHQNEPFFASEAWNTHITCENVIFALC